MDPETLPEELADPSVRLTSKLLIGLADLTPEEVAELRSFWPPIEAARKVQILDDLTHLVEDNIELNFDNLFKAVLDDEEAMVRVAAIRGLFEYDGRDLIGTLVRLLREDGDLEVRREAAMLLGRYAVAVEMDEIRGGDAAAIKEGLIASIEDLNEDAWVRSRSLEALGAISGEETENLIESVYGEDDFWMRVGAIDAMGRSCDETWLPILIEEMANEAPEMRAAAVFAAGSIGNDDFVPELAERTADADLEVRLAAVHALGEIGGANARVVLTNLLYEGDDELREAVEEAIAELAIDENPFRMPGL
jgi:HEAT repeat protein